MSELKETMIDIIRYGNEQTLRATIILAKFDLRNLQNSTAPPSTYALHVELVGQKSTCEKQVTVHWKSSAMQERLNVVSWSDPVVQKVSFFLIVKMVPG
jgi:hypothetical protein